MYKISEVAELLLVEKTEIFAKLISHKSLLEPNIKKIDGVTYFDQRGVEILKTLLNKPASMEEQPPVPEEAEAEVLSEEPVRKQPLTRYEKERKVYMDQIEILKAELLRLDEELAVKDALIEDYQDKLDKTLETFNAHQLVLLKKINSVTG
ncbi:hypothetical protein ACR6HW_10630 [Fusibacter sp. JL298sf-3]